MPDVTSSLDFLARLPLYDTEKPYLYLPSKDEELNPDTTRLDNLEFEHHSGIVIRDLRERDLDFDDCGFMIKLHPSKFRHFEDAKVIAAYQTETEELLRTEFDAERVIIYDVRLRKNTKFQRTEFDFLDPMLREGPAIGAHNGGIEHMLRDGIAPTLTRHRHHSRRSSSSLAEAYERS
jgi:hypothetical protein